MPRSKILSNPPLLSDRINAATRAAHTHLNKLILERLPLSLPPNADDPSIYTTGLLHIAPIYFTFEEIWIRILQPLCLLNDQASFDTLDCFGSELKSDLRGDPITQNENLDSSFETFEVCPRINSLLRLLLFPDLLRTESLRGDLRDLMSVPENEVEGRVQAVSKDGYLSKFLYHIRSSVTKNPHVLVAYAWILYMALFSGGRYIHASLKEAGGYGAEFWNIDPSAASLPYDREVICKPADALFGSLKPSAKSVPANTNFSPENTKSKMISRLKFFTFAGDTNGEDIKNEFKKRIKDAETLLTNKEKLDIILEAQYIFKYMIEIVWEIDALMGTNEDDEEITLQSRSLMKTRDSVSIAKERLFEKTQAQIFQETRMSSFLGCIIKSPKVDVVFSKIPFTISKGKDMRVRRRLANNHATDIGICPGLTYINLYFMNHRFSFFSLLGLLTLISIVLALKSTDIFIV